MKIVMIDDNPYMVEALESNIEESFLSKKRFFQRSDFCSVGNLIQAKGLLKDMLPEEVACIVLDLNMPVAGLMPEDWERTSGARYTGWVWYEKNVQSLCGWKDIPVVIFSAYADDFSEACHKGIFKLPDGITIIQKDENGVETLCNKIVEFFNK